MWKVEFPVVLEVRRVPMEEVIWSMTRGLDLERFFRVIGKIGEGSFAEIYLAREIGTEYLRAVKIINKERCIRLG